MKDSELIYESIGNLARYGWRRHGYGSPAEGFCIAGAVYFATGISPYEAGISPYEEPDKLCSPLAAVTVVLRAKGYPHVARFNDDPQTTYEDVVLAMKEAAYELEEQGL